MSVMRLKRDATVRMAQMCPCRWWLVVWNGWSAICKVSVCSRKRAGLLTADGFTA